MREVLTAGRLRELVHYDPETGILTWRVRRSNNVRIGDVAGCARRGYIVISVDDRLYPAHRVAHLYVFGEWPRTEIDHINMNRADNRFCNLRQAIRLQNRANTGVRSDSASGFKGVYWEAWHRKWLAYIKINGKRHTIGRFGDPRDAALAHAVAAYGVHGDFSRPHWRDLLADMRGAAQP